MSTPTLQDRMALAKRRQFRAMSGDKPVEAELQAKPRGRAPADRDIAAAVCRQVVELRERSGQIKEFESLLPSVACYYGYSAQDVVLVRSFAMANTLAGEIELALCVQQWRIDAVVHGFDVDLPDGVGCRARIQFRRDVAKMNVDENNEPYLSSCVDWAPEQENELSPRFTSTSNQP